MGARIPSSLRTHGKYRDAYHGGHGHGHDRVRGRDRGHGHGGRGHGGRGHGHDRGHDGARHHVNVRGGVERRIRPCFPISSVILPFVMGMACFPVVAMGRKSWRDIVSHYVGYSLVHLRLSSRGCGYGHGRGYDSGCVKRRGSKGLSVI